jgi:hypothetical protein
MTDNSKNFDSLQERNQQVLNNISQLQEQEKELYTSLDDVSLSSEEKQQVINKINEISQMRLNMYASIKDMYSFYQKDVASSRDVLSQQMTAVDILENELNNSKIKMNLLEAQKNNKLRLVEINTYYGKRYNAHAKIMKIIVITCIPLIILAVLANTGILPPKLYAFLSGLIIIIGVFILGYQLIDISNRDNMNWDEYNWYFQRKNAPSDTTEGSPSDPWQTPSITCIGSACCYEGSTYDNEKNMCVPNEIYNTTTNSETENFQSLGKYGYSQAKSYSYNSQYNPQYASFTKYK